MNQKNVSAILLMAGQGVRFGSDTPKQFVMLSGKPVYLHTLELFIRSNLFSQIILVCPAEWIEKVTLETRAFNVLIIKGGKTRQESSYLGLLSVSSEIVLIHDAVRPFITEAILQKNIETAFQSGAADTCIPSTDTLVYTPNTTTIENIPHRAHYMRGQTPQTFRLDWILDAHKQALQKTFEATDDCSLLLQAGYPVKIVLGSESNIKITTELDLFIAEQLFRLHLKSTPQKNSTSTLKGKIFAIVGGTGGIGSAIADQLKLEGATPVSLSRSGSHYLDLRDPTSISTAFDRLYKEYGPLDGLINSAGRLIVKPLDTLTLSEIEELLAVNLQGLILSCQSATLKPGAHLINIASSSFTRGRKEQSIYSSAKAGVVNFTQALAEERPDLHIWAVIPQRTNTSMRREHFPSEHPATLLAPQEIAAKIIEILHDSTSTGQLLEIKKSHPTQSKYITA